MPYTTQITLYAGMPFDAAYKNTLFPTSVANKKAWMDRQSACPKRVITSLMQFKIDTNTGFGYMRLPVADDDSNTFNYAHIQHKGVAFFAFILGCEYINDGKDGESVYQYKFKKDVMMSHFVDESQLKPAPITRHHSTMKFRNPFVPEPFGGHLRITDATCVAPDIRNIMSAADGGYPYKQWYVIIKLAMEGQYQYVETEPDGTNPNKTKQKRYTKNYYDCRYVMGSSQTKAGTYFQGTYDPCVTLVCTDILDLREFVGAVLLKGNIKIVDMYVVPSWAINVGNTIYQSVTYSSGSVFEGLFDEISGLQNIHVIDDSNVQTTAYQEYIATDRPISSRNEFVGKEICKMYMYPYRYDELTVENQKILLKPEEWLWVQTSSNPGRLSRIIACFANLQNPVAIDYWPLNVVLPNNSTRLRDMKVPSQAFAGVDGIMSGTPKLPLDTQLGHVTVSNFPTCAWLESPYAQAVGQGRIVNIDAVQQAWDAGNAEYTGPENGIAGKYQQLKTTIGAKLSSVANNKAAMGSIAKYTAMNGIPNLIDATTATLNSGGNPMTFVANMLDNQSQLYKTATAAKMTPPTMGGSAGGGSCGFGRNSMFPVLRHYEMWETDANVLETIFRKYGYAQGGVVQTPDIRGRSRYCYVETAGDVFVPTYGYEGMCNANEAAEINAAFMDGVCFWNPDSNLNNVETSGSDTNTGILNYGIDNNPTPDGVKDPTEYNFL